MTITQNSSGSPRQIDRKGKLFYGADTHPEFWDDLTLSVVNMSCPRSPVLSVGVSQTFIFRCTATFFSAIL